MEHFNKLNPSELERLAILAEEAAEVQQIVMKIIRHGYESYNPLDKNRTPNRNLLIKELGDLKCAIKIMLDSGDVYSDEIALHARKKAIKIQQYLHHQ